MITEWHEEENNNIKTKGNGSSLLLAKDQAYVGKTGEKSIELKTYRTHRMRVLGQTSQIKLPLLQKHENSTSDLIVADLTTCDLLF